MNILLLGAGAQGKATLYDLCQSDKDNQLIKKITVVENNLKQIELFLEKFPDDRINIKQADANKEEDLIPLFNDTDIIIDLLPTLFRKHITQLAIKTKTNLVNTSFHSNIKDLENEAVAAGIIVMPESGLDPGIDLILAGNGIKKFDTVTDFHSACGGVPTKEACDNPINYKISWIFEGVLSAYKRPASIIKNKKHIKIPGEEIFDHTEQIDIPELGTFDRYPNGFSTTYARVLGIRDQVINMGRYTLRWEGHSEFWKKMVDLGLLEEEPVAGISPRTYLSKVLSPRLQYKDDEKDLVILRNEITGLKNNKRMKLTQQLIDIRDLKTGFMAMNRTVGFTASIIAQMILKNEITGSGILNPGTDILYDKFLEEIKKRSINISESIKEI